LSYCEVVSKFGLHYGRRGLKAGPADQLI
jgi:hypothetical protein